MVKQKGGDPSKTRMQGETKNWGFWRQLWPYHTAPVKGGEDGNTKGKRRIWGTVAASLILPGFLLWAVAAEDRLATAVLPLVAVFLVGVIALGNGLVTDETKKLYSKVPPVLNHFAQYTAIFVAGILLLDKPAVREWIGAHWM